MTGLSSTGAALVARLFPRHAGSGSILLDAAARDSLSSLCALLLAWMMRHILVWVPCSSLIWSWLFTSLCWVSSLMMFSYLNKTRNSKNFLVEENFSKWEVHWLMKMRENCYLFAEPNRNKSKTVCGSDQPKRIWNTHIVPARDGAQPTRVQKTRKFAITHHVFSFS